MTALAADRAGNIEVDGVNLSYPATTAAQFYIGSTVCINTSTSLAVVGSTATTLIAVGVAIENRLAAAGDEIACRAGVFNRANSAGVDAIALDDIGKVCYIVDDQTVALTDGAGTRSPCGVIVDYDSTDGVFVQIGPKVPVGAIGDVAIQDWTATSDYTDAGTGASTTHDISSGFPTNAIILGAALEIDTPFAGEADAAVALGDAGATGGLWGAFTLNAVAAGWAAVTSGAEAIWHIEAAYVPILTYTATELGDLTAGALTAHIYYIAPVLNS
jgi:hypothetical protein